MANGTMLSSKIRRLGRLIGSTTPGKSGSHAAQPSNTVHASFQQEPAQHTHHDADTLLKPKLLLA